MVVIFIYMLKVIIQNYYIFELAGDTSGTQLTVSTNQTTSQNLNIPNITSTDTIATLGSNNTFTGTNNFYDTGFNIIDSIDNTKILKFDCLAASTGTELIIRNNQTSSQVLEIPPINSTDTIATLNSYQVFTNTNKFSAGNFEIVDGNNNNGVLDFNNVGIFNQISTLKFPQNTQTLLIPIVSSSPDTIATLGNSNIYTAVNTFPQINNSLYYGNSATPTVVLGSGAGSGASYSIVGTDTCGVIAITFGTTPAVGLSFIATITMNNASATHPIPMICFQGPTSPVAALPTTITAAWQSTNSWAILNWGTAGITGYPVLVWNYIVFSV